MTPFLRRWCGIAALMVCAPSVSAQQLSARHYTVADGLGENVIYAIHQDSRGYVWIGTYEGLTRFDGHTFVNYDTARGLPHPIVHSIVEDQQRRLWVGLFRGLVRVSDDAAAPAFHVEPIAPFDESYVGGVLVDGDGAVWFDGEDAIVRGVRDSNGRLAVSRTREIGERDHRSQTYKDRRGRLWFALDRRLIAIDGGRLIEWNASDEVGADLISGITEDARGRLLVANRRAIFEFSDGAAGQRGTFRRVSPRGLEGETLQTIYASPSGGLWLGTERGLMQWDGAARVRHVEVASLDRPVLVIREDRDRNLWVGTGGAGLFVIPSERIADYTPPRELLAPPFRNVFESPDGRAFVNADRGASHLGDDGASLLPPALNVLAARAQGKVVLDREGYWWFGGGGTLTRVHAGAVDARAETVLTGMKAPEGSWFGPVPYVDLQGGIWATGPYDGIYKVHRDGATWRSERIRIGGDDVFAGRLQGDAAGNLWIISHMYVIRRRADGRVEPLTPRPGLPETLGRAILFDSRGWMWIGLRYGGVSVTRDPNAEQLQFENYSVANGLASNSAWALCEDGKGRVYIGSTRGLDRLDPRTGSIHHLSPRDGLATGQVLGCKRGSGGEIWVTTTNGVSRLTAADGDDAAAVPPDVYFTRLRISGEESPIGQRGAATLAGYVVPASGNDIVAEFVAPAPGRALRYSYLLSGVDTTWSEPTLDRSVHFARLAAGRYRLQVRAVDEAGRASATPGSFEFRVLPPFWQQPWFIGSAIVMVMAAAFGFHRVKLQQVVALERVRRQVALDLHDDIGSGLTQIALMSEVARRDSAANTAETLAETAAMARTMRSSMSDIVWAVDPRHDHLRDLVDRMRDSAQALASGAGIALEFQADEDARLGKISLAPDRRRHVLLLFKEAFTNAVKHAGAATISVSVGVAGGALRVTVADDGRGFDPASARTGHGLHSMRTRAAEVTAALDIRSAPGQGTTVTVRVPLASSAA